MPATQLSASEHQQRQRNLRETAACVRSCLFQHRIGEYCPGQVVYNLGEYPARFSIAPTDYDAALLGRLAAGGVRLIQFHEEWNDPKRLLGADRFSSHDPAGLRSMIDLVHSLGMKAILYASSGYFDETDPDFDPGWGYPGVALREFYYTYANCSPASPGWRAYLLPRLKRLFDDYGIDGFYDDLGYLPIWNRTDVPASHVSPGLETADHDAALEDLLGMIMSLVHERSGILKIHYQEAMLPRCNGKFYDYLWVGESVGNLDMLRESTKAYPRYVVPCPDLSRAVLDDEDEPYLHAIPYLQFPLRVDGRPVTGERASVPGVAYRDDFWTGHFRRIHESHLAHPEGPHVYGWWDSPRGNPGARERWLRWLDLYRPMVADETLCWIDIGGCDLFDRWPRAKVVASLYVNQEMYLVLANYESAPIAVTTRKTWKDRETGAEGLTWRLPARTLKLLRRIA